MDNLSNSPRALGMLAGMLLLASAPSALAQVVVDQAAGVAAPCGTAGLYPCTLLSAGIAAAAPGDIITVGNGTYTETDLLIDFDVTIESAVGTNPILDAGGLDRHFRITGTPVNPLGHVALRGLILQNGYRSTNPGGSIKARWIDDLTIEDVDFNENVAAGNGGALAATAVNVTIIDSEFRKNFSGAKGGGIYFDARRNGTTLTINRSNLAENHADQEGGAVYNTGGDLELLSDTFTANDAGNETAGSAGYGGAIKSLEGTVTVRRSTFNGNRALEALASGGAIDTAGAQVNDVVIFNSTFFANEAAGGEGAALEIGGTSTASIQFSTFKDNVASSAFGQLPATITNHGTATIRGTIITGSAGAGADCDGTGAFNGVFNRIDGACFGVGGENNAVLGLDPNLALNGGLTETFTLLPGSNAINGALSLLLACDPPVDQRGYPRPATGGGPNCDIGSVEAF